MKQNLEQERANFQAMQRSAKTLMDRSDMDWKNYEKLGDFSSTLAAELVERQKDQYKLQETEAMNKVIQSGVTLEDLQNFKAKEDELEDLYKDSVKVSTDYLQKGGLPDIAAMIEGRSGHAAYGAAKGLAINAGRQSGNFLQMNGDTVVGYRDGNPNNKDPENEITLNNAQNSAEYTAAQRILSDQYLQPYAGLNPTLVAEHILKPLGAAQNQQFANWEQEFEKRQKAEQTAQDNMALFDLRDNPAEMAKTLENQIEVLRIRTGDWATARKQRFDALIEMAKQGVWDPTTAQKLMDEYVNMRGGKRKFGDTPEGLEFMKEVDRYWSQDYQAKETERAQKADAILDYVNSPETVLDPEARKQVIQDLRSTGMSLKAAENAVPSIDEQESTAAAKVVQQLMVAGEYIPEGYINQLGFQHLELRQKAQQWNAERGENMGLSENNRESVEKVIDGEALSHAKTAGSTEQQSAEAAMAARRAKEWAAGWLRANRDQFENEAKAVEEVNRRIRQMFAGIDPDTGKPYEWIGSNGEKFAGGFEASPFHTPRARGLMFSDDENEKTNQYRKARQAALNDIAQKVNSQVGEGNPYAVGQIPGTEAELKTAKEMLESTGMLPSRTDLPIFQQLAKQAQGNWSFEQILQSQLKAVYNIDYKAEYTAPDIDVLGNKDAKVINLNDYTTWRDSYQNQRLMNVNPTPHKAERVVFNGAIMMKNASQVGALSDPSDPNSPRIGSFVGGDGDLVAQGQGGEYTINMMAIPRGLGGAVQAASDKYGIPADILAALIDQESSWRSNPPDAGAGAVGIAQIIPHWHPEANPGVNDADDIMYAASYIRRMMDAYNWDLRTAVYAYNAGPNTVLRHGVGATKENADYWPLIKEKAKKYRRRSYSGVRDKYVSHVADSPYNSPDLLSPNLRARIYKLA